MGMGKIGNWEIFPWEFLGIFQNRKNAKKKTFLIAPTALNALSDSTEVAGIEDKAFPRIQISSCSFQMLKIRVSKPYSHQ